MEQTRLRPSSRTLILLGIGLVAGFTLVVTVVVSLRGADASARALASRTFPAQEALGRVSAATVKAQASFVDAVEAPDAVTRGAAIATSQAAGGAVRASWAGYLRHASSNPAEQRLQQSFKVSLRDSVELGASVISRAPSDPVFASLYEAERREFRTQLLLIAQIDTEFYSSRNPGRANDIVAGIEATSTNLYVAEGLLSLVFLVVGFGILRSARRDERLLASEAAAMSTSAERAEFETALQRGLEMEPAEESTYAVLSQALTAHEPRVPTELLLADSSQAHFRQVLNTDPGADAGCRVGSPADCPAASSGQTRFFSDSTRLDTCPFLRGRDEPSWALCVPVSVAGRTTGVIHAQQHVTQPPPVKLAEQMELVGRKAGDRIGVLRVLARTEAQAQVDPLTGLPNRRTLENRAHELMAHEQRFVVAFADLDHFKAINDTHGHDMGDRALRLFARALRDSIRPRDLPARYGGEEFVAVLPECTLAVAREVADRIRARLATVLDQASVPRFTVSVGLASAEPGEAFSEVVARADAAMLAAKTLGRDRVAVSGDPAPGDAPASPSTPTEPPHAIVSGNGALPESLSA